MSDNENQNYFPGTWLNPDDEAIDAQYFATFPTEPKPVAAIAAELLERLKNDGTLEERVVITEDFIVEELVGGEHEDPAERELQTKQHELETQLASLITEYFRRFPPPKLEETEGRLRPNQTEDVESDPELDALIQRTRWELLQVDVALRNHRDKAKE